MNQRGFVLSLLGWLLTISAALSWVLVVGLSLVAALGSELPRSLVLLAFLALTVELGWFFLVVFWPRPIVRGVRSDAKITRTKWEGARRSARRR
jgi:uncharacterized membrane protein YbhN (UPF0104 family)